MRIGLGTGLEDNDDTFFVVAGDIQTPVDWRGFTDVSAVPYLAYCTMRFDSLTSFNTNGSTVYLNYGKTGKSEGGNAGNPREIWAIE